MYLIFSKITQVCNSWADLMFVNGAPLLVTMIRSIKFVMVEHISNRKAKQLIKSLKQVMTIYSRSGMIVHTVLMDM